MYWNSKGVLHLWQGQGAAAAVPLHCLSDGKKNVFSVLTIMQKYAKISVN